MISTKGGICHAHKIATIWKPHHRYPAAGVKPRYSSSGRMVLLLCLVECHHKEWRSLGVFYRGKFSVLALLRRETRLNFIVGSRFSKIAAATKFQSKGRVTLEAGLSPFGTYPRPICRAGNQHLLRPRQGRWREGETSAEV